MIKVGNIEQCEKVLTASNTLYKIINNTPCLMFPNISEIPGVVHGASTRLGGVSGSNSLEHLASMNLSFKCGDVHEHVEENYRRFCQAVDVPYDNVVFSAQTHTTNIKVVESEDAGKGLTKVREYADIDGLITDKQGLALTIFSADCTPIIFADKKGRAVGAAHCGWRGTFNLLQQKMIAKFDELYGIDADDIMVAIGPCIHEECYEVSEELYNDFSAKMSEQGLSMEQASSHAFRDEAKPYDFCLDLPLINKELLKKAGVPDRNIFVSDLCTACHPDILFSHRASHGKRGLNATMIMLSPRV